MVYSKIMTNNQFIDNVVHVLKLLSIQSVLKNEKLADSMETVNSMRDSAIYIACKEKKSALDMFNEIPINILKDLNIPDNLLETYSYYPSKIDDQYKNDVLLKMNEYFINSYIEENNYYRMLNGLPDFGTIGIFLESPIDNIPKFLHDMSNSEIATLERNGVIDNLKLEYPDAEYLNYLGEKSIDLYKARRAMPFELLYSPNVGTIEEQTNFIKTIEKNRVYTLKTIYSNAYEIGSDYYDNFIMILIIVQTISDIVINSPELIIRREFYDEATVRDIFLSHGITYFPDIPLRYQISMIKNLNNILKFKSTTKNLVDISSIFGFDNIKLFKYYLLKDRKTNIDGSYTTPIYIRDSDGNLMEDDTSNYELKFVKVPIDAVADDYIRDTTNHMNYNDVVDTDKYWYGNAPHKEIDNKILNQHFNYVISKYISIDTIYDMSAMSFDMTYFINMIFDNKHLEENLTLFIPLLSPSHKFKLTDIICFLYVLMYEIVGIDDTILDTTSNILHVLGFNFEADISSIVTELSNKGYSPDILGIDINDFQIPDGEILTYNDLIKMYQNNKNIRTTLINLMMNTDDIHMYRIYNKIYESVMVSELNTQNFTNNNGRFAETYTEYLKDRDDVIYNTISSIRLLDPNNKLSRTNEIMEAVISALEEYVVSVDFDSFISNISTISIELAQRYLFRMINFFKSHTVQMLSMNVIYSFNNKFDNKIIIIDDIGSITSVLTLITPYRHNIISSRVIFPDEREIKITTKMPIHDSISIFRTYN